MIEPQDRRGGWRALISSRRGQALRPVRASTFRIRDGWGAAIGVCLAVVLWLPTSLGQAVNAGQPAHHTLKITGDNAQAKQDFLSLLAFCTKQQLAFDYDGETVVDAGNAPGVAYATLRQLKDAIISSGKTVEVKVLPGPNKDLFVDQFEDPPAGATSIDGPVDMSDINSFPKDVEVDKNKDGTADAMAADGTWSDTNGDGIPDTPNPTSPVLPHAETRCSAIAHLLGERFHAVQNATNNNDYSDHPAIPPDKKGAASHDKGGVKAGNDLKGERARDATSNVTTKEVEANGNTVQYSDGSRERWNTNADGRITSIEYIPRASAPKGQAPRPADSLIFRGCVLDVGPAPDAWSGRLLMFQSVHYRIVDVVSGSFSRETMTVRHLIVDGKADVDPDAPRLADSLVHVGAGLRVEAFVLDSPILGKVVVSFLAVTPDPDLDCRG